MIIQLIHLSRSDNSLLIRNVIIVSCMLPEQRFEFFQSIF